MHLSPMAQLYLSDIKPEHSGSSMKDSVDEIHFPHLQLKREMTWGTGNKAPLEIRTAEIIQLKCIKHNEMGMNPAIYIQDLFFFCEY